jgi:hypothetical protein
MKKSLFFILLAAFMAANCSAQLLYEDFESRTMPIGWARFTHRYGQPPNPNENLSWVFSSTSAGLPTSHMYALLSYATQTRWIVTAAVDLGATNNFLSFDVAVTHDNSPAAPSGDDLTDTDDKFYVLISTNDGANWTILRQWDNATANKIANISHTGENIVLNLTSYVGNTVKIAFYAENTVTKSRTQIHIDNILIDVIPSCPKPKDLTVSDITTDGAKITWTAGGSETEWLFEYKKKADANWTAVTVTSTPQYILDNLTPAAYCEVRVKAVCSGEESDYSSVKLFATACASINIQQTPWTEGFEGIEQDGEMPLCWSATGLGSRITTRKSPGTYDYIVPHSGNKFMYVMLADDKVTTPTFTLRGGKSHDFSFWFKPQNNYLPSSARALSAHLYKADGTLVQQIDSTRTRFSRDYTMFFGDFTPAADGDYYISLTIKTNFYMSIDDFKLIETPICFPPTKVTTFDHRYTSFTLDWTNGLNETAWILEYKKEADPDWIALDINTKPYTLNGLEKDNVYSVRMKGNCGTDNTSVWSDVYIFSTLCSDYNKFPFHEEFEDDRRSWYCWHIEGDANWDISDQYEGLLNAAEGFSFALICTPEYQNRYVSKLISPVFDFTGVYKAKLEYQHVQRQRTMYNQDTLRVYYRTSFDDEWHLIPEQEFKYYITSWQKENIYLPNLSATYQLAFEGTMSFGFGIAIDSLYIYTVPLVKTLPATDITTNSALLHKNVTSIEPLVSEGFHYRLAFEDAEWIKSESGILSNLLLRTDYQFRAYAEMRNGFFYGDTLTFKTLATLPSSLDELFDSATALYPNPASKIATLEIDGLNADAEVLITDLKGKMVEKYLIKASDRSLNINVSDYADGTYLLNITSNNKKAVRKLVVKK